MQGPPYDGVPCPMCPMEVRNLSAVAHNLCNRLGECGSVIVRKYHSLMAAVRSVDEVRAITAESPVELRMLRELIWEMDGCKTVADVVVFGDRLKVASKNVQRLSDVHFANRAHSHGDVRV